MVASRPIQKAPLSPSFCSCFRPQKVFDHTWNESEMLITLFQLYTLCNYDFLVHNIERMHKLFSSTCCAINVFEICQHYILKIKK